MYIRCTFGGEQIEKRYTFGDFRVGARFLESVCIGAHCCLRVVHGTADLRFHSVFIGVAGLVVPAVVWVMRGPGGWGKHNTKTRNRKWDFFEGKRALANGF